MGFQDFKELKSAFEQNSSVQGGRLVIQDKSYFCEQMLLPLVTVALGGDSNTSSIAQQIVMAAGQCFACGPESLASLDAAVRRNQVDPFSLLVFTSDDFNFEPVTVTFEVAKEMDAGAIIFCLDYSAALKNDSVLKKLACIVQAAAIKALWPRPIFLRLDNCPTAATKMDPNGVLKTALQTGFYNFCFEFESEHEKKFSIESILSALRTHCPNEINPFIYCQKSKLSKEKPEEHIGETDSGIDLFFKPPWPLEQNAKDISASDFEELVVELFESAEVEETSPIIRRHIIPKLITEFLKLP